MNATADTESTLAAKGPVKVPWEDGSVVSMFAIHRMPPKQLDILRDCLIRHSPVTEQPGAAQGVDALPWDDEPAVLGKALAERVGKEKLPALVDVLMGLC